MKTKIPNNVDGNVVQLYQETGPAQWLADIDAHAELLGAYRKIYTDQKIVYSVFENTKKAKTDAAAELECRKLPAKTKARLMLKAALNKHHGKRVSPFEMLAREIKVLGRKGRDTLKQIDELETRILMVQPKDQNEVSVLLKFLSTLLREGRPLGKGYLADVIEDCTVRQPKTNAPAIGPAALATPYDQHAAALV